MILTVHVSGFYWRFHLLGVPQIGGVVMPASLRKNTVRRSGLCRYADSGLSTAKRRSRSKAEAQVA